MGESHRPAEALLGYPESPLLRDGRPPNPGCPLRSLWGRGLNNAGTRPTPPPQSQLSAWGPSPTPWEVKLGRGEGWCCQ